jgi:hypothetical protein
MYVLFRLTPRRLMASLRESRRVDGKVRAEHLASLGAVALPMTVTGRAAFWTALHDRLGRLSNRVAGEDHGKILDAIHARIPMVAMDELAAERKNHIESEVAAWQRIEAFYGRIISQDERQIARCHAEIELHRANIRDAFVPLKDGLAAAAIQHRGALEADNESASRAFVAERDRSSKELGSILGNRLTAEKRELEALIAKATKGRS